MKLLKSFIFVIALAGIYFLFVRDRYVSYPITTSIQNTEGKKLTVRVQGRTDHTIQFSKAGSAQIYNYPIEDLDILSKIKIVFLPKRNTSNTSFTNSSSSTVAAQHMKGMQAQMAEYQTQMRLLLTELDSKASPTEKSHVQHEIDKLDIKMKELEFKMETFRARRM